MTFSYLELCQLLCSMELNNLCNFGSVHHEEQLFLNYLAFGLVVQEEMSFKDISYLELWRPLCSAERNNLCNFGRGYYEEQFCENILNFDRWDRRRCRLKDFLTRALAALLIGGVEPLCNFGRGSHGEHSCEII